MKYTNKSNRGLMVPYRKEGDKFINHIAVESGETKELPAEAVRHAEDMGLVPASKKDSEEAVKKEKAEETVKKEIQVYSEEELIALNKREQFDLIKSYGSKEKPKLEEERVKLILGLQGAK